MRSPSSNNDETSNNMIFRHLTNALQSDSYRSGEQIITMLGWGGNAE